jgi:hypothetical protein
MIFFAITIITRRDEFHLTQRQKLIFFSAFSLLFVDYKEKTLFMHMSSTCLTEIKQEGDLWNFLKILRTGPYATGLAVIANLWFSLIFSLEALFNNQVLLIPRQKRVLKLLPHKLGHVEFIY